MAAGSTLRYVHGILTNLPYCSDLIKTISLIAITSVLFSCNASSLFSVFDAYAQSQSGPATSGNVVGGATTAGGITISGTCNQCTITNAPQATGGAAASGAATSGNAVAPGATSTISTLVDRGNALNSLGMYTSNTIL
jgi:hypothetical protein